MVGSVRVRPAAIAGRDLARTPAGRPCAQAVPRTSARVFGRDLLHAALIRLPLKGVEVAFGYVRLLSAQGPVS